MSSSKAALTVIQSTNFYQSSHEVYEMNSNPRGFCVIFDNYESEDENLFKERLGSENDCDLLTQVFSQLHFDIRVLRNRTARQMKIDCIRISQKSELKDHNALVVIFLSHGDNGLIRGIDGRSVELNTLFAYFNSDECRDLANKPKIFFSSACRGNKLDIVVDYLGINSEATFGGPAWSDMLMVYSTTAGYASIREQSGGTWFVHTLAHALAEHSHHKHLLDILDIVSREISGKVLSFKKTESEVIQVKQSMVYENVGFNRKLYFNP